MLSPAKQPLDDDRPDKKAVVGGIEILSGRVRKEVERQMSPHETVLFCLRGNLSHSLVALDERMLIVKPGYHAGSTFGTLSATIYYQDVTAIQVHTFIKSGWIEVSTPSFQGRERKKNSHPRSSDRDVYKLPNCVPIPKRHVDAYHGALAQLRERIEFSKRYARLSAEAPPLLSSLERIATLRRNGAISEHEYARLKQVLLENADGGMGNGVPQIYSQSG